MDDTSLTNHSNEPVTTQDNIIVGLIRDAWGVRGDLIVEVMSDVPNRFSPGKSLILDGQRVSIQAVHALKNGLRIKLNAVNSRSEAETLRGKYLQIASDEITEPPEGSYFHFQLVGMKVWTEEDEYLGEIIEILPTGSNDVFVVQKDSENEVLIPSISDVVLEVRVSENRMTVRLLEGLR